MSFLDSLKPETVEYMRQNGLTVKVERDLCDGTDIYYLFKTDGIESKLECKIRIPDEIKIKQTVPTFDEIIDLHKNNRLITREFFKSNTYWRDAVKDAIINKLVTRYEGIVTDTLDIPDFTGTKTIKSLSKYRFYLPVYEIDRIAIAVKIADIVKPTIDDNPYVYSHKHIPMLDFTDNGELMVTIYYTTKPKKSNNESNGKLKDRVNVTVKGMIFSNDNKQSDDDAQINERRRKLESEAMDKVAKYMSELKKVE